MLPLLLFALILFYFFQSSTIETLIQVKSKPKSKSSPYVRPGIKYMPPPPPKKKLPVLVKKSVVSKKPFIPLIPQKPAISIFYPNVASIPVSQVTIPTMDSAIPFSTTSEATAVPLNLKPRIPYLDPGYPDSSVVPQGFPMKGYYDVQNQGVPNDYCRTVGDANPLIWSCALAGSSDENYVMSHKHPAFSEPVSE